MMSVASSGNNALDLFISQLANNDEFDSLSHKNWELISKLFPGTTPYQCQKRYKEIKQQPTAKPLSSLIPKPSNFQSKITREKPDPPKEDSSAKDFEVKSPPTSAHSTSSDQPGDGPKMVIHVCDEAKHLKQDFSCPRDLLVREMKYFAEYLSADAQRWEDVDISVHCDVQIFDWLMRFVKRGSRDHPHEPKLETTNVISILISSDFLKMENLIEKCIQYCHKHMNLILATPNNMNCINDTLVTRIAAIFNHNEIEELKDRKDKFRNKLFGKKVERLFDSAAPPNPDSPENCVYLYKCSACQKLLTKTLESKLGCVPSRMLVNRNGDIYYIHEKDPSWDVNDYLVELKVELKNWRDVYWRLWGTVNSLYCIKCHENFVCKDLVGCPYHKEDALYQSDVLLGKLSGSVGTHLCCGVRNLRFDPTGQPTGCQMRDHVVKLKELPDGSTKTNKVYEDLMAYRDIIQTDVAPVKVEPVQLNVFANDEVAAGIRDEGIGVKKSSNLLKQPANSSDLPQPKLQALTHEVIDDDFLSEATDDEVGDDEIRVRRPRPAKPLTTQITVKPAAILVDGPEFAGHHRNKWDVSRSVRFNQDSQRTEDIIRFRDMVAYLTRMRLGTVKIEKHKHKEYAGGIYSKLEAQWKNSLIARATQLQQQARARPKYSSLK